jgi:hypothetical protein
MPICFGHEEKMIMSTKITMAFVAAVITFASSALAASTGDRDDQYTFKSAQYCIPQLDEPPGTTRVYC